MNGIAPVPGTDSVDPPRRTSDLPGRTSELLRFSTAGSIDDGKSTLIGRLLHDTHAIADDQLAALEQASRRRSAAGIDLSLLTDGLRAEREQGITIDVAYRYFATPARRFIIADTPGHLQYTRNLVTGASTAELAVVLVDARRGVLEQTRRHVAIAALLGVPHLVGAVNKMDLVGYDERVFVAIQEKLEALAARVGVPEMTTVPISALCGDNVVRRSAAMPWYDGPPLLEHLETVELESGHDLVRRRFPVQWVIRGDRSLAPDYRAYAGRVEGGVFRPGDQVVVLPSGIRTRIAAIDTFEGPIGQALPPRSVAIRLVDEVDLGRGGLLVGPDDVPPPRCELDLLVCWLGDAPLTPGARYVLQHTTRTVRALVADIPHRVDISTLAREEAPGCLGPNDIGRVRLRLTEPVFADPYRHNRSTGAAILIDPTTNTTVGAALVLAAGEDWP